MVVENGLTTTLINETVQLTHKGRWVGTPCTVQLDILAGIMFGRLLEERRKFHLAYINLVVTGSRGTIATPSPGVYTVGTILADFIFLSIIKLDGKPLASIYMYMYV